jgi:hypothetical protein
MLALNGLTAQVIYGIEKDRRAENLQPRPQIPQNYFIGRKSPAALSSDISFVAGGKKRGQVYSRKAAWPWRVATPGPSSWRRLRADRRSIPR